MENWTGSLIKRKNESLTTNKLNYVCQEVKCTQQAKGSALNSRNPWEGLFSGLSFIFLPGLCDRADPSTPRWLLTRVRSGDRILHWPQAPPHQLQWHLHPSAELLRLITLFTHSCKASRQGQVWSPISCVVWQESAVRHLLQLHALYPGGEPATMPSPHQTFGDLLAQGVFTERS